MGLSSQVPRILLAFSRSEREVGHLRLSTLRELQTSRSEREILAYNSAMSFSMLEVDVINGCPLCLRACKINAGLVISGAACIRVTT
jgi:hypothetical protein